MKNSYVENRILEIVVRFGFIWMSFSSKRNYRNCKWRIKKIEENHTLIEIKIHVQNINKNEDFTTVVYFIIHYVGVDSNLTANKKCWRSIVIGSVSNFKKSAIIFAKEKLLQPKFSRIF